MKEIAVAARRSLIVLGKCEIKINFGSGRIRKLQVPTITLAKIMITLIPRQTCTPRRRIFIVAFCPKPKRTVRVQDLANQRPVHVTRRSENCAIGIFVHSRRRPGPVRSCRSITAAGNLLSIKTHLLCFPRVIRVYSRP